jgi:hypothetical protein
MASSEKPMGIALIVCDRVITDARTQEKTLVATFNRILSKGFPCLHPRMCIFVAVTNGRGPTNAQIRCVNEAEKDEPVFELSGTMTFPDPNHVVEMNFQMNNVTFKKPGLHSIEFLCDGELILHRRFQVVMLKQEPSK